MKKNILSIICAAAAMTAAVSCANKENTEPETPSRSPMQFSAGTPALADFSSDVKTAIGEDGMSVLWSKDDAIGIFDTKINKFDLIAGAGTSTGRFSGFALQETQLYALYPYDETASISGSTISATLPSVQYSVADGTFDTMLNPAVAKPDASNNLAFDHVAAMLKITIDGGISSAVKSISLAADKSLAGAYTVDMSQDTWSAVAASSETPVSVSLTGKDGANLAAAPYYLVILPGTYSNLTLTVTLADGTAATGTISNLTVAARDIKAETITLGDFGYPEFGFAPGGSDLTNFSYKGEQKTYTVCAPEGTAWTLAADSEDVSLSATEGTGMQKVTVTLPYSKYIYNKEYTLTLKAAGQTDITLTITQNACVSNPVGITTTDGTLTAENSSATVKTYDKFKYGTFVWKFSNVNLTSGYFLINNWEMYNGVNSNLFVRFGDIDDDKTGFVDREGKPTYPLHVLSADGKYTIGGNTVHFGFENGWGGNWGYAGFFNAVADCPQTVNEMTTVKLVLEPVDRLGGQNSGWGTKTLKRELYINDKLMITNQEITSNGTIRYNTGDIWQSGSGHPGFQFEFGIAGDSDDPYNQPGNGSMTIDSFEYIPYSAQ